MYNVSDELKTIYRNDILPFVTELAEKDIDITFAGLNLTVGIDQFAVDKGDFELHESICMEDQLKFGKCNASQVKFTLADVTDDINGEEFEITQTVIVDEDTSNTMPLGYFTVDSAPKEDDLRFKDITAYDRMKRTDIDVSAWYKELFPTGDEVYTLAEFRASFLTYIGITEDTSKLPLPNDSMTVPKTIDPSQLSGRTVIEACEEINGCFGLMGRDGKFNHIILKPMHHDYPQDDYPQDDYPELEPYDEYIYNYQKIHFEEYRVKPIDKIQIRQEENDIGAIYGTGTNCYIIQGNFLVYGKSASELQTIAQNASVNIFDRGYRPYEATGQGLPYIMPGDFIKYNADDTTVGYVFERTLTGLQALQDEYCAKGSEVQTQNFGVNNEIIQIKGKQAKIEKSVEGVKVTVSDLSKSTSAMFEIVTDQIVSSVADLDEQLTGEMNVLAGQVVLKVDSAGRIGYVDLGADPDEGLTHIKLKADNISLEGLTTVNEKFKVLADGSIEAVDAKFSGNITSSTFIGGSVQSDNYIAGRSGMKIDLNSGKIYAESGASFTSQGAEYSTTIHEGRIDTELITMESFDAINHDQTRRCYFDYMGFHADIINGGVPITAVNIGSQSVNYATSAGTAGAASAATYANSAGTASYALSAGSASGVGNGGSLGLFNISPGGGFISYQGALKDNNYGYVYVGAQTLQAGTIQQISLRESKDKIKLYEKNAVELICNTPIHNYILKDNEEDKKIHVGVLIDEAPDDIIGSGGMTISLYDMISVSWKAIQELKIEFEKLKSN